MTTEKTKRPPLNRLLAYTKPRRREVAAATVCSLLNKVFDLAPPALIGAAVDVVVERDESLIAELGFTTTTSQLVVLAIATVVIWALESLFEYLYGVLWRNLAQSVQHDLRLDAYRHVQRLEMGYFEDRSTGGLMAILNDDINQLERFLDGGANALLQVGTTVVVVSATFFFVEPTIALMAITPVPIILWGSFKFQSRIAPRYADVRQRVGDLNALLANNLGGITTIKSFTKEDDEVARVRASSQQYMESNRKAIRLSSAFSPLIRMAIVIGFTATLLYGGYQAIEGALAVGAYSVLVFLTQRLLWPLTRLGTTFDLYQRAMASTERALDLLDTRPGIEDGETRLNDIAGQITFDDVEFAYRADVPVLRKLSLRVPAGETIAVVGATGAGKTSVVKLLLRLYDIDGGSIAIDGNDIRTLELRNLRNAIGLVAQDVFLFEGTVRENIAYGARTGHDPTDAEIEAAARAAEAHDFIQALPEGYDTVVGERGQKLSGGQRQRLAIARAVLKDPPILVLDEATSSVDNETEAAIQRSMARIGRDRTVLVIAHRLSTVRHADTIYVLAKGQVVESGTHDDLIERDGTYASLWAVQTGEVERQGSAEAAVVQ